MKIRMTLTLLTLISLIGCSKDSEVCKVNFQIIKETLTFRHTWKLIGFQVEGQSNIDYPPCDLYKNNSDRIMTISFADTLSNLPDSIGFHKYPYLFKAISTINSFEGTYEIDSLNNLKTSDIFSTLKGGSGVLMDYEKKYYNALTNAKKYLIKDNILTIFYNQTDKMLFVSVDN